MSPVKRNIKTPDQIMNKLVPSVENALLEGLLFIERKVVEYFNKNNINVSGYLRNSITSEVRREAERILGIVGTNLKYAIYVHQGTRPHWPPVKPIKKWVMRKLGIRGADVPKVTFLVRRKISKEGTKAKPFFTFVFNQYQNRIAQIVASRLKMQLGT